MRLIKTILKSVLDFQIDCLMCLLLENNEKIEINKIKINKDGEQWKEKIEFEHMNNSILGRSS